MWRRAGREMVPIVVFNSVSFRARVLAAPEVGRAEAVRAPHALEVAVAEVVVTDQGDPVAFDRDRGVAVDAGVQRGKICARACDAVAMGNAQAGAAFVADQAESVSADRDRAVVTGVPRGGNRAQV